MDETKDLTMRERLVQAGVLLPAQRDVRDLPPPVESDVDVSAELRRQRAERVCDTL